MIICTHEIACDYDHPYIVIMMMIMQYYGLLGIVLFE